MTISQMKIIYGITKSNFGGAQRYVFDLAKHAKLSGHEVAVLCGEGGVLTQKLEEENIRVITIPGFDRDMDLFHDASRLLFIIKTIWREKPDVFHINSAKMGGAGIFTGRLLRVPKIIFTGHGWAFNEPRPEWQKVLIKFFSWLTILAAHQTICVSESFKKDVEHWPLIKGKTTVIHNGIDKFDLIPREQARRELGLRDDTLAVGALAELHPIKGLDILIEAWDKFSRHHRAELIIMGEGEERRKLEQLIETLGLSDSITLKGYVGNARRYLSAFDIFCLPSRSENLPYAVLEAGIAGLPVIASSVGGIPEIVESGKDGILVEKENSEDLFSTLLLLSANEDLRKRLGSSLQEKVSQEFSTEKMFRETIATYL